jgi:hypothetical protein
MSSYKDQILDGLIKSGWELVTSSVEFNEWFIDEQWKIKSIKENWGLELYVTFMVDPQWVGLRKKGQGVNNIIASLDSPHYFSKARNQVCELWISKRKFNVKLKEFLNGVNSFRLMFCPLK